MASFNGFNLSSVSFRMSPTLDLLSLVLSSLWRASSFLLLYFKTPAASSKMERRSNGLLLIISSILPCDIMLKLSLAIPLSKRKLVISLSLTLPPFRKYSLVPSRYTRLFISTSSYSIGKYLSVLSKIKETEATFIAPLLLLPEKMTSVIDPSPRSDFTDCSPKTQRTASTTLLLPEPFGPTIPLIPFVKTMSVLSANDLKPWAFISFKYILSPYLLLIIIP